MTLPYATATSGKRSLEEIQKILRSFGCSKFATGTDWDTGDVFLQFEHNGRMINLKASAKGYAAALLRESPWTHRKHVTKTQWEQNAIKQGEIAVYSILRDWVKGQTTAIECGIMTFEAAFLSHIMLPNGQSVIEQVQSSKLLPPPERKN